MGPLIMMLLPLLVRPRHVSPAGELVRTPQCYAPHRYATLVAREVSRVRAGTPVRVATGCDVVEGRVLESAADSVRIAAELAQGVTTETIAFTDVGALWVRQRNVAHHARQGSLLGAVTGGLYLVVASPIWCVTARQKHCERDVSYFIASSAFGAVYGAALGAAIGSFTSRWERRYPPGDAR